MGTAGDIRGEVLISDSRGTSRGNIQVGATRCQQSPRTKYKP